jgi:hypothetical protein
MCDEKINLEALDPVCELTEEPIAAEELPEDVEAQDTTPEEPAGVQEIADEPQEEIGTNEEVVSPVDVEENE